MRAKFVLLAVAGAAFVTGGITVGVLLTRGGPVTDPKEVKAAEPEKKDGLSPNSAEEYGPMRFTTAQEFEDLFRAQGLKYVPAGGKPRYGVKFVFVLEAVTVPEEVATELLAFAKKVVAAKKPAKTVAASHYAYFEYRKMYGGAGTLTFTLFTDDGNKNYQQLVTNLEAALKDVEALKKEEPAFQP